MYNHGHNYAIFKPYQGKGHMAKFTSRLTTYKANAPLRFFGELVKEDAHNPKHFSHNLKNGDRNTRVNFSLNEAELGEAIAVFDYFLANYPDKTKVVGDFASMKSFHDFNGNKTQILLTPYESKRGDRAIGLRVNAKAGNPQEQDVSFTISFNVGEISTLRTLFEDALRSMMVINGNYELSQKLLAEQAQKSNGGYGGGNSYNNGANSGGSGYYNNGGYNQQPQRQPYQQPQPQYNATSTTQSPTPTQQASTPQQQQQQPVNERESQGIGVGVAAPPTNVQPQQEQPTNPTQPTAPAPQSMDGDEGDDLPF